MRKIILFISFFVFFLNVYGQSGNSSSKAVYISKIPRPTAPAFLIVSDITFNEVSGNGDQVLDANENGEIKFTITNKGKGQGYNLTIKLNESSKLIGLEFPNEKKIGDLNSGSNINISIPIHGNNQLETGLAMFDFLIKEGNDFDSDPFKISFKTQEFKNPLVKIADYKFTTDEAGKIKLGHPVSLSVVIQNQGQGDALNIEVSFKNPENVFPADETNFVVNKLKPNESKSLVYDFFANKKYSGVEIPIEVTITESYKKYGEIKDLSVSLERTLTKTQQIVVNAEYALPVPIEKISLSSDVDKNIPYNKSQDENKFALVIGNEDYSSNQQDISSEINVEFARNDASIFKEYCIKSFGVPTKNIIFLLDATTGKMSQAIDKLNKLIEATSGKATVIVYYAGHGLPDEKTKEPYLIPVDVSGSNISSAIKLSFLYQKLTEHPSKQITLFIDACFSGGGRNVGLLATRGVKVVPKYDYLNGNIVVFTASSEEESALPWKEKQHGIFTYFLLKKIQETNATATLSELSNYLIEKVELESVRENSKRQNPQVLSSPEVKDLWGNWKLK